jgi:sarcosine oxidase subunit beta
MIQGVEVAIIGGGIHGVSLAYHLAEQGCTDVVVFEKARLGGGATAAAAGGIRHQFSTPVNVRLSLISIQAFVRMAEETDNAIGLCQQGYLILATRRDELTTFKKNVAMQRRLGVDVRLLSPQKIKEMAPYLNVEDVLGATFCGNDGWVDPYSVLQFYVKRAKERGVRFLEETRVYDIKVSKGRVVNVLTAKGEVAANFVVNAAGPWAAQVGKMVGVELPVRPYRRQSFVTEPFPPIPEDAPFIIDFTTSFYFHKEMGGEILMGMSDPDEPSSFNTYVDWSFLERVVERALHRAPILQKARVNRGWAGLYSVTPDNNPILGITQVENFIVVVGFSGHGFMHAPAVGQALAELIVSGKPKVVDISPLNIGRFTQKTEGEYNVI